jgi:ankyrin repeat protein
MISNYEMAKYLIDRGADVNIKNRRGMTALHYAIENRYLNLAFLSGQPCFQKRIPVENAA